MKALPRETQTSHLPPFNPMVKILTFFKAALTRTYAPCDDEYMQREQRLEMRKKANQVQKHAERNTDSLLERRVRDA